MARLRAARTRYGRNRSFRRQLAQGPIVQDEISGFWFPQGREVIQDGFRRDGRGDTIDADEEEDNDR